MIKREFNAVIWFSQQYINLLQEEENDENRNNIVYAYYYIDLFLYRARRKYQSTFLFN